MKVLFASSFHYPAFAAPFKHGLITAREYAALLKDNFLYLVLYDDAGKLANIPHQSMAPRWLPLRRFRLISLFFLFYSGWFFLTHPSWRGREVIVLTQESKMAAVLLFWRTVFRFSVLYECHGLHSPLTDRFVCKNADALVFVTKHMEDSAKARFGTLRKSTVIPNAVDREPYVTALKETKPLLRASLGLPGDVYLVGYVGRFLALGVDKGINLGLDALALLKDSSVHFCFVGGTEKEIEHFRKRAQELGVAERTIFVPYQQEQSTLARYTVAMDALIYTPPPHKFFQEETSPMKLYEYMAASRPILVADFPAIREMLSDQEAFFLEPGSPQALASTITYVQEHPQEGDVRAQAADRLGFANTWRARIERVLTYLSHER
ncbi:MAG TPA: glycosyltransferase family 4 protein [Candidatus Paceibacterota bacterium]|nr:glycosyltransferase family 4 protein [Candidatus Paceibacterota bacterium]